MVKKAIILDLDNTIYPVPSIGDELFSPLFQIIAEDGNHVGEMKEIKDDIMRRPFQRVAADFKFSDELTQKGIALLKEITYKGKIEPFEDFAYVKDLSIDKYLVTTGFLKMQQSKVENMGLEHDFNEIHIIDPDTSPQTKKDVFAAILERHSYQRQEVLVIGDDLHSEIKAAQELGLEAVLYNKFQRPGNFNSVPEISDFRQLKSYLI